MNDAGVKRQTSPSQQSGWWIVCYYPKVTRLRAAAVAAAAAAVVLCAARTQPGFIQPGPRGRGGPAAIGRWPGRGCGGVWLT